MQKKLFLVAFGVIGALIATAAPASDDRQRTFRKQRYRPLSCGLQSAQG
jgi:hypothetical protein